MAWTSHSFPVASYHLNQLPHPTQACTTIPQPSPSPATSTPLSNETTPTHRKAKLAIRARLGQLCKAGQPDAALRILEALPNPTTLLWNTLLIGFICNGMPVDALRLYPRITTSPDSYTFSSLLKACALLAHLKLGRSLHCRILRTRPSPLSRVLGNSLLGMYSACLDSFRPDSDRADLVRRLFDSMRARNVVTWNTMVAWYVRTGRAELGVRHFGLMLESGLKPSPVSFVNVFKSAAEVVEDRRLANMLYGLLLKFGAEFSDDVFVVGSAVFMYCRLGDVGSARRVFDVCEKRNVEVWNTMMDGYVHNDQPLESLNLFMELIGSKGEGVISPDGVTFLAAIMAVSQLQELKLGQQMHSYVIKRWAELPIILSNALAVMYSRCDALAAAFRIFDSMLVRDVVTWNTMISAFVQNGFDAECVLLVREMQKQNVEIDAITVIALLSAASNLRDLKLGRQIHAYIFRHGIELEGMDSYLIDVYAKSGVMKPAEKLFKENDIIEVDQVTWNAMIAGYVQNMQHEEAIATFKQMIELNKKPNSVTVASILPACDPASSGVGLGKQLHGHAVRHLIDTNVFVGTALVDMYAKGGSISQAERVFGMMPEKSCVTYTTMILGYGQNGCGEDALSLFYAMQELGIEPDAVTVVAVLSACSYAGLVSEGISIFESMEENYGVAPTFEHHACLVDILGRAGRVKEAYKYVEAMGEEGNVVGIWGSLLGACRIHREFELGKLVAERLLKMERGGDDLAGYHVLVSNMLAHTGEWDGVDGVRKEMREKGLRKEVGCSWIDVGGVVHRFASRDQRHSMRGVIDGVVEELSATMKSDKHRQDIDLEDLEVMDVL